MENPSKLPDAYIDVSITCMGCGTVLYCGAYKPGVIGRLKRMIKNVGWKHHPEEGTLCPNCLAAFYASKKS